jgi:biotin synthase
MNRPPTLNWLLERDELRLEELWRSADDTRRRHVGDAVHLRGLIEISNHCVRRCGYCGLNAGNAPLQRYRMSEAEILACAAQAHQLGCGTVVMQAGEDYGLDRDWIAAIIARIKATTPLAVTLSLGERADDELLAWRQAGADRYLVRLETSNRALYDRIHPPLPGRVSDRVALLLRLRDMGYEIGSGVMVGIPGQTYADLAADIETFARLDLDMIGLGPFIPHPATELGKAVGSTGLQPVPALGSTGLQPVPALGSTGFQPVPVSRSTGILPVSPTGVPPVSSLSSSKAAPPPSPYPLPSRERGEEAPGRTGFQPVQAEEAQVTNLCYPDDQAPADELTTYKMLALARLACPRANIPSTTALATLNRAQGRELGLMRGANVIMPNLTPTKYRALYEIYPNKACIYESAEECFGCVRGRIESIGRSVGQGPGTAKKKVPSSP